jgi:putative RNA 2'-phosphotransferase
MKKTLTKYSKFLSLILRHKPEEIGINLDENGWVDVEQLIQGFNRKGYEFNFAILEEIVYTNDKNRFCFNEDFSKIRANQGHSKRVDLGLTPMVPPDILYHGTATRFWPSICKKGLIRGSRQYVHLSQERQTASKVGIRHGKLLVLLIASKSMHAKGHNFYLSKNRVWLTDHVPVEFISICNEKC